MKINKEPAKIQKLFNEISPYYDKINNLISLGAHYLIKVTAVKSLQIKPKSKVLDVCCGTGDMTEIINKIYENVNIIGLDFSENMLQTAKNKNPNDVFVQGDCTRLPFGDGEFDYVTMCFGLRNIADRIQALNEIHRVLKNNGRFLNLDFWGGGNFLGGKVFSALTPLMVKIQRKNIDHYKYLLGSIKDYPSPNNLEKEFNQSGFRILKRKEFMFGAICLQIVEKF